MSPTACRKVEEATAALKHVHESEIRKLADDHAAEQQGLSDILVLVTTLLRLGTGNGPAAFGYW
jgi:hypothetical protein